MTNFEKIKNMSIEELAEFLITYDKYYCDKCISSHENYYFDCNKGECMKARIQWLESEVQE